MKDKIDHILRASDQLKASDIHITVGVPPIFRMNGDLRGFGKESLTREQTLLMAKSMMSEEKWQEFQENGEIDFSYSIPGVSRFRVNTFNQRGNVGIAIRTVPAKIPQIDQLFLPEIIKKMSTKPQGLILVTGPTGSGKSTTLASMINYINQTMSKHIITLEDPIEYLHKHGKCIINQREVGADTKSFKNALRSALRQDPDVILVGELRDLDTISTALTAAETGHLVFGTLHTQNAPSTVDRIIDVFPASQQDQVRIQLASVLVGIISQRLFPTVDGDGRRAATEILVNNPAVANLIRNEKIHQIVNVMQTSKAAGMHTLDMDIKTLVDSGVISKEIAEPFLTEEAE
jgi:twitching motility protein PilT